MRRERQKLHRQVVVVLKMPPGPGPGMELLGVPTLPLHVVDAEHLNPSVGQMIAEDFGHVTVCPLVTASQARWKDEHSRAGMAEDQDVHVTAERGTMPGVMLAIQKRLGRKGEMPVPSGSGVPTTLRRARRQDLPLSGNRGRRGNPWRSSDPESGGRW